MRMSAAVRRASVGLIGGAALLVGLPASPAAAADTSSTAWVTYGAVPAGGTVQTVQGVSDGAGGCAFNLSASLAPGATSTRVDEVAFNASSCQSQVALTSGASSAAETAEPSNTDATSSGDVVSPASSGLPQPADVIVAAAAIHSAGYMKSWYQDPVGLVVNSVRNGTDWYWDRTCVRPPVFGSYRYTWFSPSGWSLQANNWSNFYSCAQSTSSSYAHFHNGIFCAFIATDTYYNRNTVHGQANGTLAGSINAVKSGGCIGLLSFHYSLRRTLN